jgi:octaprenyl-diphosphate synthase
MFVLLSSQLFGAINPSSFRAASMIELLHTATLVHDDVVDEANLRRSFFSINAIWKNKIAVLIGDYLLAKGLLLCVDTNEFRILQITSNAVKAMSEGELLQIEKARKLDINEDVYFKIIKQKTASLLAAACASGAFATSKNDDITEKMRQFGEYVGIAFQIKDDLLDYGHAHTGKTNGADIKEKKMTLPLIYALTKANIKLKKELINIVKRHNTDSKKVAYLMHQVNLLGGITYATAQMNSFAQKALSILDEFPNSDAKSHLKNLVHYSISREK